MEFFVPILVGGAVASLLGLIVFGVAVVFTPSPPPLEPPLGTPLTGAMLRSLFRPPAWRKLQGPLAAQHVQTDHHRPLDIELPEDRVLAPPRAVQGVPNE